MTVDRTLQSIADVLADHEAAYHPGQLCPEDQHGHCAARPRPVPSPEDRMRDARLVGNQADVVLGHPDTTDRSFATYLDATERDQLDARAATAEAERDEATEDRDLLRAENANLTAGLRAERVKTGRLEGDLRSLAQAVREALAERDKARRELDTKTEVARGNKRHVAYLTAALEAINALHQPFTRGGEQWCTECSQRDGERFHFLAAWPCATHKAIDLTVPPAVLGSADRRAQEPTAGEARRLLDQAIDTALPLAGRSVRKLLKALRRELARVDAGRAPAGEPS